MKKIFKYKISWDGVTEMPVTARIVKFNVISRDAFVWAEIDFEMDPKYRFAERLFRIFATGEEVEDKRWQYVETCFDSVFVWHLYEYH